jgi:hypothetical protein
LSVTGSSASSLPFLASPFPNRSGSRACQYGEASRTTGLTISGNQFTVFIVESGVTADLTGLTVANGAATHLDPGFGNLEPERDGGGIYNAGNLSLTDSSLVNNYANYAGGGLFNDGGATLNNVTISGNYVQSNVTSGNYAFSAGGGLAAPRGSSSSSAPPASARRSWPRP